MQEKTTTGKVNTHEAQRNNCKVLGLMSPGWVT
jgi:hypothetical protein